MKNRKACSEDTRFACNTLGKRVNGRLAFHQIVIVYRNELYSTWMHVLVSTTRCLRSLSAVVVNAEKSIPTAFQSFQQKFAISRRGAAARRESGVCEHQVPGWSRNVNSFETFSTVTPRWSRWATLVWTRGWWHFQRRSTFVLRGKWFCPLGRWFPVAAKNCTSPRLWLSTWACWTLAWVSEWWTAAASEIYTLHPRRSSNQIWLWLFIVVSPYVYVDYSVSCAIDYFNGAFP